MRRRAFLRGALVGLALSTGLAKASLSLWTNRRELVFVEEAYDYDQVTGVCASWTSPVCGEVRMGVRLRWYGRQLISRAHAEEALHAWFDRRYPLPMHEVLS